MNEELVLRYAAPARDWNEVLPLGNGRLGAMVWGGTGEERIALNEGTLWSGCDEPRDNPRARKALPKVRKLAFAGRYARAQRLLEKRMLGGFTESYMPLGELRLWTELPNGAEACEPETPKPEPYAAEARKTRSPEAVRRSAEACEPATAIPERYAPDAYERTLSLADACARVTFTAGGMRYARELFASYPHRALLLRLTAQGGALQVRFTFESQLRCRTETTPEGIHIHGQCPDHVEPDYTGVQNPIVWGDRGLRFTAALTLLDTDGTAAAQGDALAISGASYAVLAFTAVETPDLRAAYASLGFDGLYRAHADDYGALFGRVSLTLGPQLPMPTDERLRRLQQGGEDPGLYALYFQYGRYLMIASSRPGGKPINLQGLWNWMMQPPWSSNYTTNINLQMNYWPALAAALPECMEPYFRFLGDVCRQGKRTAETYFGCGGFTLSHNSDGWAHTNPVGVVRGRRHALPDAGRWAWFPLGGVWLCQPLWQYYEYTGDTAFLRETALPLLREAVRFCLDYMVEHDGYWVVCPSTSPENAFYDGRGRVVSVAWAATLDMELIREAFGHFRKACEALGETDPLLAELDARLPRLYPFHVGKHGQLQEWCEDFDEPEPGHRHVSHLFGLYPSEQFAGDARLTEACRRTIERRLAHGGGHTGWSCAWLVNLLAVLGDAQGAYEQLHTLLTRSTYPNLWDGHPPFQIDGNFGGLAGMCNMLAQDRGGAVKLLPALPKAFAEGEVRGLRLKGGKALDMRWKDSALLTHRIYDLAK